MPQPDPIDIAEEIMYSLRRLNTILCRAFDIDEGDI